MTDLAAALLQDAQLLNGNFVPDGPALSKLCRIYCELGTGLAGALGAGAGGAAEPAGAVAPPADGAAGAEGAA